MAPGLSQVVALVLVIAGAPVARGQRAVTVCAQTQEGESLLRVRAVDNKAASVLRIGMVRSRTFKTIAAAIERSDVVVYVQTRPMRLPGQLHFVGTRGGRRYLRIYVRIPAPDAVLAAWLGHELQHAAEIAAAPEIVDEASLLAYYERVGSVYRSAAAMETMQAQQVARKILSEVRYGR